MKNYEFVIENVKVVVRQRHIWGKLEYMKEKRTKLRRKFSQTSKKRNVMSLLGAVIFWMEFVVSVQCNGIPCEVHIFCSLSLVYSSFLYILYLIVRKNIVMLCSKRMPKEVNIRRNRKTDSMEYNTFGELCSSNCRRRP